MDFGGRLKYLRESAGMSQTVLAKKLQVKRGTISAWEAGACLPHSALLKEVALVFHVTTDYLLGLEREEALVLHGLSTSEKWVLSELITCLREHIG